MNNIVDAYKHHRVEKSAVAAQAESFAQHGFAVHWLKERSKAPAGGENWQNAAVLTPEQLRATYRSGMNLGLRTGEPSKVAGLYAHVFDVDIRFDDLADEAWEAFDRLLPGIRKTLPCVVSGSGGESRHLHFLTDKPFYGRKLAVSDAKHRTANGGPTYDWEIDLFGTGRQVAMPPSIHPGTGIAYRWEREYDLDGLEFGGGPIIDSAVIEALGIASTSAFEFESKPPRTFAPGQLERELDRLSLDVLDDRPKWIMLGQALHHQFGGSQEGFDLWMHYSKRSANFDPKKRGEETVLRDQLRRYRGFGRNRREPLTMGTVLQWNSDARLADMLDGLPDLDNEDLPDEFDALLAACSPEDEAALSTGLSDADSGWAVIRRMNRRHAVVLNGGRTLIVTEDEGAIHFGTANDLHTFYENDRRSKPGAKDSERAEQSEPVSKFWMRHRERRTYPRGVVFAPGKAVPGFINLWRGWAVEAKPDASCQLIRNHVVDVICQGNAETSAYLFGWMAHLVQRPAEKPGVAIVLRGGKGAGKDTLGDYLAAMMGRYHAPTVSQEKHITGNFNRRLESALLLHVQEGTWAGDHKAEGVLKYLVTSDSIEIERKGIDTFQLDSFLRLFSDAGRCSTSATLASVTMATFERSEQR